MADEQFTYVTCPSCSVRLRARQTAPAGRLKCPKCSTVFAIPPSEVSSVPPVAAPPRQTEICGFWRRIFAFLIDSIGLGIVGFIMGIFMFSALAELGPLGLIIGFGIALLYFGILNSSVGRGQTLGKRLLGIKVINKDGSHISLPRSLLRYTVFGMPFFLNGAYIPLPASMASSFVGTGVNYVLALIVFGAGGAIIYLYIFNRRTRQTLHDLAAGTYVIRIPVAGQVRTRPVWKGHAVVMAAWFVLITVGMFVIVPQVIEKFAGEGIFPELLALQQDIHDTGKVHYATVNKGTNNRYMGGGRSPVKSQYLQVTAVWKGRPDDIEAASEEVAEVIMREYRHTGDQDNISITVKYGFDIGIADAWKSYTTSATPAEWRDRLMESGKAIAM